MNAAVVAPLQSPWLPRRTPTPARQGDARRPLPDGLRSILTTIAGPARSVATTSELVALHEMQQQTAERCGMDEADARPARPGAARAVDHSMTGAGETGEGGVDVGCLQCKMVQGPEPCRSM